MIGLKFSLRSITIWSPWEDKALSSITQHRMSRKRGFNILKLNINTHTQPKIIIYVYDISYIICNVLHIRISSHSIRKSHVGTYKKIIWIWIRESSKSIVRSLEVVKRTLRRSAETCIRDGMVRRSGEMLFYKL